MRQSLLGVLLLGAHVMAASAALSQDACGLLAVQQSDRKAVLSAWEEDRRHQITLTKTDGRKAVVYAGDILHVNKDDMQSLIRPVNLPRSDIETLVFDARKLVFDGPLSFDRAHIVIRADAVTVGPRARIRFSDPKGSSVRILARTIDLDERLRRFLVFFAHNPNDVVPIVGLTAETVRRGAKSLDRDELLRILGRSTLDTMNPDAGALALEATVGEAATSA